MLQDILDVHPDIVISFLIRWGYGFTQNKKRQQGIDVPGLVVDIK